jgi:long-chain acyl-CoA synthetase
MGDLLARATARRPDSQAIVDGDTRVTWAELSSRVELLAAGFDALELEPRDRVALQTVTSLDFVTAYLAALQCGLVVVPVNPGYTVPELNHILGDSGASLLITSSPAAVGAADILTSTQPSLSRVVVAARSGTDEVPTLAQVAAMGEGRQAPQRWGTGEDLAVLLYTSGTSGRPKGAMLPVRALLANLEQLSHLNPVPLTADDRLFLPLPLFHVFGLNAGLGLGLYCGATIVLGAVLNADRNLATMAAERVTVVAGAPVEFAVWVGHPDVKTAFANVRLAISGAAPLPGDLVARYGEFGVPLFEGYGLTEAAPVVTSSLSATDDGTIVEPKAGSIGRPLPGLEVRLIDEEHEVVEPGDLGLLEVRGSNLFLGYWPDGADGPDSEGWFATGDMAVADDDGDLYLVGRRSDLILVNGFNVYPAEVEAVLQKLPGVAEVAVVGLARDSDIDMVAAYIVPMPGVHIDQDTIIEQASASLARFKLPQRVIEVDQLPHTATGKVMKWRLTTASAGPDARTSS